MNINDSIGFLGVFILLIAFLLNLINILEKGSFTYIILNILGAGIACFASILISYLPFIILEGVWAAVSLGGLINKLRLANK